MQFASPIPLWAAVLAAVGIGAVSWFSYRRPLAPLTTVQRGVLASLRAASLGLVVFFLCRPVAIQPLSGGDAAVVPILVDVSRSMRIADAGGETRLDRAAEIAAELVPALSGKFTPEVFAIGDTTVRSTPGSLSAGARQTDLVRAIEEVQDALSGRSIAGMVILSDGADTGNGRLENVGPAAAPVIAVGVGSLEPQHDREVLGIAAGEARIDQSTVDVRVTAVSHRLGRAPFTLRLLANGSPIDSRKVTPPADGTPFDQVFTVSPDLVAPTVYTAEIAPEPDEAIAENNSRSVLVRPPGRKRRVLMLAGAPGYDHSFAMRALAADPGLEVDAIIRKGRNDEGEETFLLQAAAERAPALTTGFPSTREALFAYDALVVANLEADFFSRAQLDLAAAFVSERGGGLLVYGSQSFAQRSLIGTPLEEALPVELSDRRGGLARTAVPAGRASAHFGVSVTTEGEAHPVMRIAGSPDEIRKAWAELPPLASSALLGGPRPGAAVLAVTSAPSGGVYPLLAVQRYGRGRTMVFAGEGSWRWRMMRPAVDRSYELFWRQAARWLAAPAPDPVSLTVPAASEPGELARIQVDARDPAFAPVPDADVEVTLTRPDGQTQPIAVRRDPSVPGRFVGEVRPEQKGLYRVRVDAARGTSLASEAGDWFFAGGADREFEDPRLNEGFLRRLADATGGRYAPASDAADISGYLDAAMVRSAAVERRDLWHEPWAIVLVIALLSAEWILRRRWGLR